MSFGDCDDDDDGWKEVVLFRWCGRRVGFGRAYLSGDVLSVALALYFHIDIRIFLKL